jgi:uncharacterized protein
MKKMVLVFAALLLHQVFFGLNPQRTYDYTPEDFGMKYQEVKIQTEDDLKLNGWLLEPLTKTKRCIVFCHGGEVNMQEYIEKASNFVSLGYWVLMFDYRGYGTSDDFKISPKFYIYSQFAIDVTAALDWVKKYKAVFSIDMYGTGIGAGLAVSIGANRKEVKYVIGDGTYASLETVQKNWQTVNGSKILMPFGYDKVYMEPKFALESEGEQLEGVLLIQSTNDKITTAANAEELAKLKKKITTLYLVESTDNKANFETDKDTYFKKIKEFLGK